MLHRSSFVILLSLILGLSFGGLSQRYDALQEKLESIEEPNSKLALIDEILGSENYKAFPDTIALLYFSKAQILFQQTVSIEHAITAIDEGISNITYEDYPKVWLKLWYYKGFYYRKWDKYEEAKNMLSTVLKYRKNNEYLWDATIQMGKTFKDRGEFSLALDYYRKAITLAGDDKYELSTTYEVIAYVYLIMETKEGAENALPWLEKLITVLKTMKDQDHFIASMTYNKACAYMTLDDLKNARADFEASERIMNKCCEDKDFKSLILESKAVLLKEEGRFEEAIDHFEKSLALYQHSFDLTRSDGLASTYTSMAETYEEIGDLENALKYINDALDYRLSGIDRDIESQIISEYPILNNGEKHYLIEELLTKGKILEKAASQNPLQNQIQDAIDAFLYADILVDKIRFEHLEESTKQFWREKTSEVYQHLVSNYVAIEKFEEAFHYAEKSKYLLMGEHLVKKHSEQLLTGLPASLRSEYTQVRKDIRTQKAQLETNQLLNLYKEIDSIKLILIDLRKKEDDIVSNIKQKHADFFYKKFFFEIASIENIQTKILNVDQTLVEYFLTDTSLFIFLINERLLQVEKVTINEELVTLITSFRNNITHPDRYEPAFLRQYANDAAKLYDLLIAPIEENLKKDIIVIADNAIALVPFSILLTKHLAGPALQSPLLEWPYLLYKHRVSFLHSASLELLNYKNNSDILYDKEILAFNPSFNSKDGRIAMQRGDTIRGTLLPLLGTIEEIEFAKNLFQGDFFMNKEATESNFKNALSSTYAILHIASHAIVDDKNPAQSKLVLSPGSTDDGMLYTSEINDLNLESDLVILSACNTGVGQITNGEGINSLARSFAHAGSQNILMSLWPISHRSTTSLIKEYYKALIDGNSKRNSLNDAKNAFLNNVPAAYHHPYFWGSFVYYGDDQPLRINQRSTTNMNWLYALIGIGLFGFFFYVRIKK